MSSIKHETKAMRSFTLWQRWLAVAIFSLQFAVFAQASETADQRLRDLEALLTRAGRFDFKAHVVSTGAIGSDLTADVGVANAGIVVIRMKGTLQGKPDDVVFRTDGIVTIIGKGGEEKHLPPGKSMRQAVQLGFARVGLWHNLLLLSYGSQPEKHEGGILDWANVSNVHYASVRKKGITGVTFNVIIEGQQVGQATLWLDDATHLPVRREQSITIDGKTINTVEDYSDFVPTA